MFEIHFVEPHSHKCMMHGQQSASSATSSLVHLVVKLQLPVMRPAQGTTAKQHTCSCSARPCAAASCTLFSAKRFSSSFTLAACVPAALSTAAGTCCAAAFGAVAAPVVEAVLARAAGCAAALVQVPGAGALASSGGAALLLGWSAAEMAAKSLSKSRSAKARHARAEWYAWSRASSHGLVTVERHACWLELTQT